MHRRESGKIKLTDPDSDPLFQRPFIFPENEFIQVLPMAQLVCINELCLKQLTKRLFT